MQAFSTPQTGRQTNPPLQQQPPQMQAQQAQHQQAQDIPRYRLLRPPASRDVRYPDSQPPLPQAPHAAGWSAAAQPRPQASAPRYGIRKERSIQHNPTKVARLEQSQYIWKEVKWLDQVVTGVALKGLRLVGMDEGVFATEVPSLYKVCGKSGTICRCPRAVPPFLGGLQVGRRSTTLNRVWCQRTVGLGRARFACNINSVSLTLVFPMLRSS